MMSAAASVGIKNIRAMRARLLDVTYIIDLHFDKATLSQVDKDIKNYKTISFRNENIQIHYPFSIIQKKVLL